MAAEFVLGAVSLVITQCFPLQLISIFGSEDALYERFAVLAFRIYLCMLPLATVNKAAFIFMQALAGRWNRRGCRSSGKCCSPCRS